MTHVQDFALLAPVPEGHVRSGQAVAEKMGFVAFGSRKFELFRKIEADRGGQPVPVLIYPSHEDEPSAFTFRVSWIGLYVGSVETDNGSHPQGPEYRPPTTFENSTDNRGYWAVFWHVRALTPLPRERCFPISDLQTVKGGWRKNAPPRGPELVAVPPLVEFPE